MSVTTNNMNLKYKDSVSIHPVLLICPIPTTTKVRTNKIILLIKKVGGQ